MYLLVYYLRIGATADRKFHIFDSIEDMNKFIDGWKTIEKKEDGFIEFEAIKKYRVLEEVN